MQQSNLIVNVSQISTHAKDTNGSCCFDNGPLIHRGNQHYPIRHEKSYPINAELCCILSVLNKISKPNHLKQEKHNSQNPNKYSR